MSVIERSVSIDFSSAENSHQMVKKLRYMCVWTWGACGNVRPWQA